MKARRIERAPGFEPDSGNHSRLTANPTFHDALRSNERYAALGT